MEFSLKSKMRHWEEYKLAYAEKMNYPLESLICRAEGQLYLFRKAIRAKSLPPENRTFQEITEIDSLRFEVFCTLDEVAETLTQLFAVVFEDLSKDERNEFFEK